MKSGLKIQAQFKIKTEFSISINLILNEKLSWMWKHCVIVKFSDYLDLNVWNGYCITLKYNAQYMVNEGHVSQIVKLYLRHAATTHEMGTPSPIHLRHPLVAYYWRWMSLLYTVHQVLYPGCCRIDCSQQWGIARRSMGRIHVQCIPHIIV